MVTVLEAKLVEPEKSRARRGSIMETLPKKELFFEIVSKYLIFIKEKITAHFDTKQKIGVVWQRLGGAS
jgi:hypothetical protein